MYLSTLCVYLYSYYFKKALTVYKAFNKKKLFSVYKAFETLVLFNVFCQHRFTLQFAMSKSNQVIKQIFKPL
jgi:hypothetical protein